MAGLVPAIPIIDTPTMKPGYVYILASRPGGAIYVGVTGNLVKRVTEHKSGQVAMARTWAMYIGAISVLTVFGFLLLATDTHAEVASEKIRHPIEVKCPLDNNGTIERVARSRRGDEDKIVAKYRAAGCHMSRTISENPASSFVCVSNTTLTPEQTKARKHWRAYFDPRWKNTCINTAKAVPTSAKRPVMR